MTSTSKLALAVSSLLLVSSAHAGLAEIEPRDAGFASVGNMSNTFGDFGTNADSNSVELSNGDAFASASASFTDLGNDAFRFSSSSAVRNTPMTEATAQVLNGADITIDSLTRMTLRFVAEDASITTTAGLADILGYFRFSAGEFGNPDFSGELDAPGTDENLSDAPLLFSTFEASPFDEAGQSAVVDLPAGTYEFVYEFGYLGELGNGAASIDMLDFLLSFEELEAPDDGSGDNGGTVGGGPGDGDDGGGVTVVPLPASVWGGLAAFGLAGFGYFRKR